MDRMWVVSKIADAYAHVVQQGIRYCDCDTKPEQAVGKPQRIYVAVA